MNKVKTIQEAEKVFDLLGIKEVGKRWQHKKGTWVYELPFKTYYGSGHSEINRFSVYKSGYVRKMCVAPNGASRSCWQLNKVRQKPEYFKDYKWNEAKSDMIWTGKYRKIYNNERIMIDNHRDRIVYLCNYILKNYYNNSKWNLVGEYAIERINKQQAELRNTKNHDLPFFDGDEHDLVAKLQETCQKSSLNTSDVRVLIDGHRYILNKIG